MDEEIDKMGIDICGRVNPEGFLRYFVEGHVGQKDLNGLERDREVYKHVNKCRDCNERVVKSLEHHAIINPSFDVGAVFRNMTYLEDGKDHSIPARRIS